MYLVFLAVGQYNLDDFAMYLDFTVSLTHF